MSLPWKWISFDGVGALINGAYGELRVLEQFPSLAGHAERLPELRAARLRRERELCAGPWRPWSEILARSLEEAAQELFQVPLTPAEKRAFPASFLGWPPFPEAPEQLRRWSQQVPLALLGHGEDLVLRLQAHKHFRSPFGLILSSESLKSYKPATAHWGALLAATGARPEEILHVASDPEMDLAPAASLGIPVAWVQRDPEAPEPDLSLAWKAKDLEELATLLDLAD